MDKMTFAAEEIFEEIPGDPDNVIMNIPEEIRTKLGWVEGDILTVTAEDGAITITKK